MNNVFAAMIGTVFTLAVIFFALWFFERMFASKPGKHAGLAMPALLFVMSTFSVLSAVPVMMEGAANQEYSYVQVVLITLLCLLLFNIPTIWTYFVYRRTRKKLGREAWPFRGKSAGSDDKKNK